MFAQSFRRVRILTLTTICLWLTPTTASAAFTTTVSGPGVQTSVVAGVTTEDFNTSPPVASNYVAYTSFTGGFTITANAGGVFGISAAIAFTLRRAGLKIDA